jgi:polyisoprenoid-binding protein YceI
MRILAVSIAAVAAGLALSASAQPAEPPLSGRYTLEPVHTQVLFGVSHLGFSTYYGAFSGASGMLRLDGVNPAASQVEVTVPTASVSTLNDKLTGELRGGQWLDAADFPTITFRSTRIVQTGPDSADVAGDVTLHGVTRPVLWKAKFNRGGVNPMDKAYTVGFEIWGTVRRSEFGVSTYVPMVGDEVKLIISAAFERQPS